MSERLDMTGGQVPDVPYIVKTSAIPSFLAHMKSAQVPDKVTQRYLESAGFTSKNERALMGIFKSLGFLSSSGTPTDRWTGYRGAKGKAVLAQAIRETYSGLFAMYPDAHRKDDEALTNWIRTNTTYSADVVRRAVSTFKTLVEEADFSSDPPVIEDIGDTIQLPTPVAPLVQAPSPGPRPSSFSTGVPGININVQLELAATDNAEIYDAFFAAMKKHLFGDDG